MDLRSSSNRVSCRVLLRFSALLIVAAPAAVGCSVSDTIVLVRVSGDTAGLQQMRATVTIAGKERVWSIPKSPSPISLPTSFTVQVDRTIQGRVDVTVEGLDESNAVVAEGSASLPSLIVGQTNQLPIHLGLVGGPGPDGGVSDGGPDGAVDGPSNDLPGSGGAGGPGTGGLGTGGTGTGGAGGGAGGRGGAGTGGAATGGAGTGGAGTGGAGTGGAGTGGAATGGSATGGSATGGGTGNGGAGGQAGDDGGADDSGPDA